MHISHATPVSLPEFSAIVHNNWDDKTCGLFTKAEFREFCKRHHISVPNPHEPST
ncbi:MAG: hypothetical protein ACOYK6_01190 [Chthoniobacterales bacterium]